MMEKKKHKFYWEDQDKEDATQQKQMMAKPLKIQPLAMDAAEQRRPKVFSFSFNFPKMSQSLGGTISLRQTEKDIVATVPLKGFDKDSIKIDVSPRAIRIKAESKQSFNKGNEGVAFSMSSFFVFDKTTSLPSEVEPGKYDASFSNGILTVTMPKKKKTGFRLFG